MELFEKIYYEKLSVYLWIYILGYLSEPDIMKLSRINLYFKNLVNNNFLWKILFFKKFHVLTLPHRNKIIIDQSDMYDQCSPRLTYIPLYNYQLHENNYLIQSFNNNIYNINSSNNSSNTTFNDNNINNNNTITSENNEIRNNIKNKSFSPIKIISNIFRPKLKSDNDNDFKPIWKEYYKERKLNCSIDELYHMLTTMLAFPLDFDTRGSMRMYTMVFNICLSNYKSMSITYPSIFYYKMLLKCCNNHLQMILVDSDRVPYGKSLIHYYLMHWQNYLYAIKKVGFTFRYFNREWVAKHISVDDSPQQHTVLAWWSKILKHKGNEFGDKLPIVYLEILMARGWLSVLINGLQNFECLKNNNSNNKNNYDTNNNSNSENNKKNKKTNRLLESIELCNSKEDKTLVYAFLVSLLHLQDLLIYTGEEPSQFVESISVIGTNYLNFVGGGGFGKNQFDIDSSIIQLNKKITQCELCDHQSKLLVFCDNQMEYLANKCHSLLNKL